MFEVAFWLSILLIVYHHLVYPPLLRRLAKRRVADAAGPPAPPAEWPSVTVIVPAHNEARFIAAKIANLSSLDYPASKLQVVIALDGCTDATSEIAASAVGNPPVRANWRIVGYRNQVGKIAVLNDQIAQASTDLVALTDASAILDPQALVRAAASFCDDSVGVVCGTYGLAHPASEGERLYWQYQTGMKADEAAVAAPMGAHGAFYAFRRRLWSPLPADTINDDFVLPMRIVLQGYRAIYDSTIVAMEQERGTGRHEFRRRIRIGAGNLQQALRLWRLADPRAPRLAFVFLSGKGLRAVMPFLMAGAFASSLALAVAGSLFYSLIVACELSAAALAAPVIAAQPVKLPHPFALLGYLVAGHLAAGIGSLLLLTGRGGSVWRVSTIGKAAAGIP